METILVTIDDDQFCGFEEHDRGVLTDAGWIDWDNVAGWLCWSKSIGRYVYVPK